MLSETMLMIYDTNLKSQIRSMGSFLPNLSDFIVKHQISLNFHKFHQFVNFYQPYLKCMVIQITKFLIEWHITSFKRKIVFKIIYLFLIRNTYYRHDFISAVTKVMMTRYSSDFYLYPSLWRHFLFPCLSLKINKNTLFWNLFENGSKSNSISQTNFTVPPVIRQEIKEVPKLRSPQKNYGGSPSPIFSYNFLEPYFINTDKSDFDPLTKFQYVDHVEVVGLQAYPKGEYIHTNIPITFLLQIIPLTKARKIASMHGISAGSRCNADQLQKCSENHSCFLCSTHLTVFAPQKKPAQTTCERSIKFRKLCKVTDERVERKALLSSQMPKVDSKNDSDTVEAAKYPPKPIDNDLTYAILSNACNRMLPESFEEAGCAVCGELKPFKSLSRLKNIKNLLHILSSAGVTRIERKEEKSPVREYSGPVLDYSCSHVCDNCRGTIRNGKVPRLALANGLWLGKVPDELKSLRFVEKLLIAKVRHTCSYVKVASGMRKMKANIIAFESPVPKIYNILPPPREDLDDVLAILFTGPCKPTQEQINRTPFLVRRNYVAKALKWLKLNHVDYADIEISVDNLKEYREDLPPVSIEYREAISNKVAEGTSVFDADIDDGAEKGDCPFTVHGLTGDVLDTMTTNAIKAMAIRHLNSGGKMLAVGHSDKFESMWNNPQLYPQMFPWLFPYGLGGIGSTDISDKAHKQHLLMYHDKRFQVDINFPFVAFCHEQTKASSTQSFLLVDQRRFGDITQRLLNLNQNVLSDLAKKMEKGEYILPETDAEKACFQVINDLDHVSGKMHGSLTTKKYMRNEIWSLINYIGAPSWYITLSPADIQHPICVYFADSKKEFKPDLLPYDQRVRLVCQNPVAGARFFHFIVESFIIDVLGVGANHRGLYGDTEAYYGTVEQQGRLTLHLHMLIWIKGCLNPKEMRSKILDKNSKWQKKVIDYLESCHTGDFLTGSQEEVIKEVTTNSRLEGYFDPTQTNPDSPPSMCKKKHETVDDNCKACLQSSTWWQKFKRIVDDLILKSNVHSCEKGRKSDGSSSKKKAFVGCRDNKWNRCKARFPRPIIKESFVDDSGAIHLKKSESWINTFTPIVTYLYRCNTDITSLSSGTAIKAVVLYVSDYITKSALKTHTIFDSIKSVFHKSSEMIGGSLPSQEKARRIMTKVVNLLSAKIEMGAPMICMYLLGNPDHYTNYSFVPFYWQSFLTEVRKDFDTSDIQDVQKVALIKRKGKIFGLSPVYDYIYRSPSLENICLYDWIQCYERKKIKKSKSVNTTNTANTDLLENEAGDTSDFSLESFMDESPDNQMPRPSSKKIFKFKQSHPLYDSHASHFIVDYKRRIPNFIGATLPRCDQGDRNYYCSTMLTLFKPWRKGHDLKSNDLESWDECFNKHRFTNQQDKLMKNFNIKYECLDARDDYRAQLKRCPDNFYIGSWELLQGDDADELNDTKIVSDSNIEYDDIPFDSSVNGKNQFLRLKNISMINMIMENIGWTNARKINGSTNSASFKPDKILSGIEWEEHVKKMKQNVYDKRNANNKVSKETGNQSNAIHISESITSNVVKIIDQSYLTKNFNLGENKKQVEDIISKFSLNTEQERAFRIIGNHAVNQQLEQLKMYLGGMGGTGKSRVIEALSYFFAIRNEAHRFVIVAPTGTAAALLGGSTYHYMFGINDFIGGAGLSKIKARLSGVEYVFFDEVSMLSARDLYRISNQLSLVLNTPEQSFGGLNIVFSGDFAQLPPAVGGENVSLYSRSIGSIATSKKSQEESIGKALWHQFTTVVILRQNMRQKKQTAKDNQLRSALENMRYKACTPENISFLRTLVSSNLPGCSSICDDEFRNVSIITAKNVHKDEINRLGALRFSEETSQVLTDFYSEDSCNVNIKEADSTSTIRLRQITQEIQKSLWSQPPSSNNKNIAGKLSLCIGLPVMIRNNFATELCMTRGQEGFVLGWQSRLGKQGQAVLDTLFIKLKNPPSTVKIDGLPENIVPIYPTTNNIISQLPDDRRVLISRTQLEVLVNFSMTDFASQGKTRPYNVVDLNNLQTHQAYYTALSRSSTAKGTLILQGFDPKKITGGCSGALRQEFRELEILDEMTTLKYNAKLPVKVQGDIRNVMIKTFRESKGIQYVPKLVHPAIRWSKRDPLPESEIFDIKLIKIEDFSKKRKGLHDNPHFPVTREKKLMKVEHFGNKRKCLHETSELPMTQEKKSEATDKLVLKKTCLRQSPVLNEIHYIGPQGFIWSNNSCAYDSSFVVLFILWCSDKNLWTEKFQSMGNQYIDELVMGFIEVNLNLKTLESVRDDLRRKLEVSYPDRLQYGHFTSLDDVFEAIFQANFPVRTSSYVCSNNHVRRINTHSSFLLSAGAQSHSSISSWTSLLNEETSHTCHRCGNVVDVEYNFLVLPSIIAFDFSGHRLNINHSTKITYNGVRHKYRLAGIIYFGHGHFTTQVVLPNGQLWFHDGISTGRNMTYQGNLTQNLPDLSTHEGKSAVVALYAIE